MAADVSSLVRLLNGYKDDRKTVNESAGVKSTAALMTRDLLGSSGGGGGGDRSLELDLDLQVPNGWEKRLDLKSGKVYLQRCNTTTDHQSNQTVSRFQDLNFPPNSSNSPAKPLLNLFDDTSPDHLKQNRPSQSSSSSLSPLSSISLNPNFESVCTLDKVKSALERAERDRAMFKKRQSPDNYEVSDHDRTAVASPVAAGCPGCLSYVLVMKNNPKCPRCNTMVPFSAPSAAIKKPKIDLNISI